ncbi:MAG TPA: tetratricopeptide repeat protein [Rhizomicrobium sp.]|nr:tetratricopeptide repeat protein [Rhizomicrobium sp.]
MRLLRQRARLAQARKDWPAAVALWRRCREKAPGQFHNSAYLSALIYANEIDAAEAEAAAHVRRFPSDESGPIALARIAEAYGDVEAAITHWQAALALRPGNRQALIRLGAALLSLKRADEADECAAELLARYPREPHGAVLQAQVRQQRNGWDAAAPLWRSAVERFPNDLSLLRAYGRALTSGGAYDSALAVADQLARFDLAHALRLRGEVLAKQNPFQDHTAFWEAASAQLPDNADITRKLVHAALWARQFDKAEAAFRQLLARHSLAASDSDFIVGFANACLERGENSRARALIRAFLKAMRGRKDYRAAALRLVRAILALFPRRAGAALAISRNESRFLRMVQNARLSSGAADPLVKVTAAESAFRHSRTTCLLDTDIDAECCRSFVRTVREHLANKQPFSLVRLGDGEANAFQEKASLAAQLESDAGEREIVWWGRMLAPEARVALAHQVREAALEADALGFPTREWFLRDVRLDSGRPLSATKSGRGLLSVIEALESQCRAGLLSDKSLVSAHLPQDLQRWKLYGELLNGAGEVVLVSCHRGLPAATQKLFELRAVHQVLVPPGDSMREMEHRALTDDEVPPNLVNRALAELGSWPQGRLVLVGAGYAGKVIVGEAKRRGGIALDLGSIFDRWMGAHTRSYQDVA